MNTTEIRDEIAVLTRELTKHQADVDLLNRLKAAAGEVSRLKARLEKLTADLSKAMDADAKAERDKIQASVTDLRIVLTGDDDGSIVRDAVTITYKWRTWNPYQGGDAWEPKEVSGFAGLDPRVMRYLLEHKPDALPTKITSLAPGDPHGALDRYFRCMRAGYLVQ